MIIVVITLKINVDDSLLIIVKSTFFCELGYVPRYVIFGY